MMNKCITFLLAAIMATVGTLATTPAMAEEVSIIASSTSAESETLEVYRSFPDRENPSLGCFVAGNKRYNLFPVLQSTTDAANIEGKFSIVNVGLPNEYQPWGHKHSGNWVIALGPIDETVATQESVVGSRACKILSGPNAGKPAYSHAITIRGTYAKKPLYEMAEGERAAVPNHEYLVTGHGIEPPQMSFEVGFCPDWTDSWTKVTDFVYDPNNGWAVTGTSNCWLGGSVSISAPMSNFSYFKYGVDGIRTHQVSFSQNPTLPGPGSGQDICNGYFVQSRTFNTTMYGVSPYHCQTQNHLDIPVVIEMPTGASDETGASDDMIQIQTSQDGVNYQDASIDGIYGDITTGVTTGTAACGYIKINVRLPYGYSPADPFGCHIEAPTFVKVFVADPTESGGDAGDNDVDLIFL